MKRISLALVVFFSTLSIGLTGCDDNPVTGDDDDHEHAEVEGLRLVMNGVNIYTVLGGEVSCAQPPCGLVIESGEETPLITVEFLDEDGDEIHAEDLDDAFSLGFEVELADVAEIEQHDEDGPWAFHVHGEEAGITKVQVKLMHNDHADFTTPPFSFDDALTVTVTPST